MLWGWLVDIINEDLIIIIINGQAAAHRVRLLTLLAEAQPHRLLLQLLHEEGPNRQGTVP